jgi:hypothetical protein
MAFQPIRDWSNLNRDYERLGSVRAVAKEYGVNHESVRYQMKKAGIERTFDLLKTGGQSALGRRAELFALSILPGAEDTARINPQYPFDVYWEGKRINVKSSSLQGSVQRPHWMFRVGAKDKENCDYFACVLYLNEAPYKALLIPSNLVPSTGITVPKTENSRYIEFLIWDKDQVREG